MTFADPVSLTQEMIGLPGEPCVMVVFGAGGDLTKRKLVPALYNLSAGKLLPEKFAIVGISREALSTDEFRQAATQDIKDYSTMAVDAAN
jgi:glucose-6-phosphate 1-dehydrogenase